VEWSWSDGPPPYSAWPISVIEYVDGTRLDHHDQPR
jgi:hypothetical protein